MRRFLTASHGPLSEAILKSASLIAGNESFREFRSIGVVMSDSRETVMGKLDEIFSQYGPDDEIVAITDVFGGSITNALMEYIPTRKLHIVTGMNLGMVLEAGFSDPAVPVEELVKELQQVGHEQILYANGMAEQTNREDEI